MRRLVLAVSALLLALTGVEVGSAPQAAAQESAEAVLTGAVQVDANGLHTCARLANGRARCWGSNYDGESGVGVIDSPEEPPRIVLGVVGSAPLEGITQIATGYYHTCAVLRSSQARCWGYNGDGQVGNGSSTEQIGRAKVVATTAGPLTGVTQLGLGERHSCARLGNGQARCWGENEHGEVGDGSDDLRRRPRVVRNANNTGPLTGVRQIVGGEAFTCALLANGQVRCWGTNTEGQLGRTPSPGSFLPVVVRGPDGGPLTGVTQISAGESHACARVSSGQARCWGSDGDGQLGNGPAGSTPQAQVVLNLGGGGPLTGVTSVAAGGSTSCARLANGQARCWGRNGNGQMADGSLSGNLLPRVVQNQAANGPLTGIRQVSLGEYHSCFRLDNGRIRCAGLNSNRQLGDGTDTQRQTPRLVIF